MAKTKEAPAENEIDTEAFEHILETADVLPVGKKRGRGPGMDVAAVAAQVQALSPKACVIAICELEKEPSPNKKGELPETWDEDDQLESASKRARGRAQTLKTHFAEYGIAVVARANKVWAQHVGFLAEDPQ